MTTNISEVQDGQRPVAPGLSALAEQLVAAARTQGVELTGPGGLLTGLTKRVLEKDKYPAMVTMWERSRAEFVPFLDFRACRRIAGCCCGAGLISTSRGG